MSLKNTIDQRVLSPSLSFGKDIEDIVARIVSYDSKTKTCTLQYDTEEGLVQMANVAVRISFSLLKGGCPEEGDFVYLNIRDGVGTVTDYEESYGREKSKKDSSLDNDIYSDMVSTDTQGGWIY